MAAAPILLAVVVGLAAGVLRRGRFAAIGRTRLRHPEFLVVAIACGVVVDTFDVEPAGAIAVVGLIGGLAFTGVNIHLTGMAVIGVGLIANLVPVAVNGAMPVRPDALVEAEMVARADLDRVSLTGARELADDDTMLEFLGDTIPVRFTGQVLSIGDLIMIVGLADVVANLMLQRRRRRVPPSAVPSLAALGWHEGTDGRHVVDLRTTAPAVDLREPVAVGQAPSSSSTASPVHD